MVYLSGAREEFLKAHEFYRRGESKDTLKMSEDRAKGFGESAKKFLKRLC